MAVVTTAGDYAWAAFGIRHTMTAGVLHGVVLLGTLGAFLGSQSGRLMTGAIGGLGAGAVSALAFYAMAPALGVSAMFAAWALMWVAFAALDAYVLRRDGGTGWIVRGLVAAIAGGLAFYTVSGVWTQHADQPNYFWNIIAWLIAWWPGLAALTFGRTRVGGQQA